jgi:hypothetical protein
MILKYSHCLKRITFSDLIIVAVMLIHATPALADELVKLDCRLDITYRQSDGIREKKILDATFEVFQSDDFSTLIIIGGNDFASLDTAWRPQTLEIKNTSNATRWELAKVDYHRKDATRHTARINIDRNTGQMYYYSKLETNSNFLVTEGGGRCEKIDSAQKKF